MAVVYALKHVESGKAYIGSTASKPAKRFREHRCLLRGGKHTSKMLQVDWDAFGETAFLFEIIEDLGHNAAFERKKAAEQKWLDTYAESGLLYNAYRVAYSMPAETVLMGVAVAHRKPGRRWTPEVNERRRLAQLGKPKGHGAKISATKRAKREAEKLMR